MLQIYTHKSTLPNCKKNLVIRSRTMGIMTSEEFMTVVHQNNSTLTEADIAAVFNVITALLFRHVNKGMRVQMPFGSFYATARGTMNTGDESFLPGSNDTDHSIEIHFAPDTSFRKAVKNDLKWERVSDEIVMMPKMTYVYGVDGEFAKTAAHYDTLVVKGEYLDFKIDPDFTEGGLFMVASDGTKYKTTYFQYVRKNTISFRVGSEIPAGEYTLLVVTPYGSDETKIPLTITA